MQTPIRTAFFFALSLIASLLPAQMIPDYYPFANEQGKWGIIGEDRSVVLQPTFDWISMPKFLMNRGSGVAFYYATASEKGKSGLINEKGTWLFPAVFDSIFGSKQLEEHYRFTKLGNKYGLLYLKGATVTEVLKPEYEAFTAYRKDMPWVAARKNGKVGALQMSSGAVVVPFEYASIEMNYFFSNEAGELSSEPGLCAHNNNKTTCFRGNGQVYTGEIQETIGEMAEAPPSLDGKPEASNYQTNLRPLEAGKYLAEIVKKTGSTVIQRDTIVCSASIASVYLGFRGNNQPFVQYLITQKDHKLGVYTVAQQEVLPMEYDAIEPVVIERVYLQGWRVQQNGLWGFVNQHFIPVQPCIFTEIQYLDYKTGYAKTASGFEGYFNRQNGRTFLPPEVDLSLPKRSFSPPVSSSTVVFRDNMWPAQYPGGKTAFEQFLQENAQIPLTSQGNCRTVVQFTVEKDGSLSEPVFRDGTNKPEVLGELKRLFPLLPKYAPGISNGLIVRSVVLLAVRLKD